MWLIVFYNPLGLKSGTSVGFETNDIIMKFRENWRGRGAGGKENSTGAKILLLISDLCDKMSDF